MEPQIGPVGRVPGAVELPVERAGGQVATVVGRQQQRVRVTPHRGGQVCLDHRHQVRRARRGYPLQIALHLFP